MTRGGGSCGFGFLFRFSEEADPLHLFSGLCYGASQTVRALGVEEVEEKEDAHYSMSSEE